MLAKNPNPKNTKTQNTQPTDNPNPKDNPHADQQEEALGTFINSGSHLELYARTIL